MSNENKVVLPEPDAWLAVYEDREGNSKFYTSTHKELAEENDTNGKPQPLYTEQQVRTMLAAAPAPAAVEVPDGWREQFASDVYADLAAADNQDIPLEDYPARILKVLDSIVGPRHPVVIKWRNDAIQNCIAIAYKYCRDPESYKYLRQDLEALLAATPPAQVTYSLDADPAGIRAMVADAITGALALGAQNSSPPPNSHWLAPFWKAARAERELQAQAQDVQLDSARVSLPIHWMKELVALCGPEDHELRDRVLKSLERLPLAHAGQLDELNKGEVLVVVTGYTGTGKSAVAGEIEIMCRALGLEVEWPGGDSEKNMTHADWTSALEQYRPRVRIVERNVPGPIAASAAQGVNHG